MGILKMLINNLYILAYVGLLCLPGFFVGTIYIVLVHMLPEKFYCGQYFEAIGMIILYSIQVALAFKFYKILGKEKK